MIMQKGSVLVVGEICVDLTLPNQGNPTKMRLGGIAHAARALWAADIPYSVGAVCPAYLLEDAREFFKSIGCDTFHVLGIVKGAPNVIVISDVREVGHQGYEDLLRERREVQEQPIQHELMIYETVVVFPGEFSLATLAHLLSEGARVVVDIAYGMDDVSKLEVFKPRHVDAVISTSSELFSELAHTNVENLVKQIGPYSSRLLLKENRGGSRLYINGALETEIPAVLGTTVNSVGVGDAFTAIYAAYSNDAVSAAWRGMQVATEYAQTTFPDDLKTGVRRAFSIPLEDTVLLGGTVLPWHERPKYQIYLAAPDFSYANTTQIETAVRALEYHNFVVRRPIKENGEAVLGSKPEELVNFYIKDVELIHECALLFCIPIDRDPGTLVEMGMAMALHKPVVTFDPQGENNNTMVVCGSSTYSGDLDACLNGVFESLSRIRRRS